MVNERENMQNWANLANIYSGYDALMEGPNVIPYTMSGFISEIGLFADIDDIIQSNFGSLSNTKHEREVRLFLIIDHLYNLVKTMDESTKFEITVCTGIDIEQHFSDFRKAFKYQTLAEYVQYVYGSHD